MSINNAFDYMVNLQGRAMDIVSVVTGDAFPIKAAPSNYFRNLAGVEEIIVEGFEFVISKKTLEDVNYGIPQRGDRLIDPEFGDNTIKEIRPMVTLGGDIIGYRVRTS